MPRPKSNKPKKGFMDGYKTYDPSDGLGRGSVNQWRSMWEGMTGAEAKAVLQNDNALVVLGFAAMPNKTDLDKRYRELVMKYHPDRPGGDAEMFKRVHAAWTLVSERLADAQ